MSDSSFTAFINFDPNGSVPTVFNPATFVSSAIQTTNLNASQANFNNAVISAGSLTSQPVSNSTSLATTSYVDSAISNLIGSSPSLLTTLQQIDTAINNDPSFSSTITNSIATKGGLNTSNNWTQNNTFTQITMNSQDLNTRITTDETNISNLQTRLTTDETSITNNTNNITNNTNNITTNTNNITTNTTNISSINTTLATKANDNAVVHLSGSETITGTKTFNTSPIIPTQSQHDNSQNACSTAYCDLAISNLISGAPSTLSTLNQIANLLQTDTNSITSITNTMVDNVSNQTIGGIKTFSSSPMVPNLSQGNNSSNVVNSSYVDTGLALKANTSDLTSYLTQTNASNTYCPLTNANINVNELSENINTSITVSTNALSVSYSSNQSIFYITPSSANNMTLTLSNIPTSNNKCSYTITFLINTSTYKQYINAIYVNSSSYTMIAGGGLSNISVNSSSSKVLQQITIMFLNSSTPIIMTNVISLY